MTVSDHAILRYLERVQGIDVAALMAQYGATPFNDYRLVGQLHHDGYIDRHAIADAILTPTVRAVCRIGTGNVKTDRMVAVIIDHKVITILPARARSAGYPRPVAEAGA